MNRNMMVLSVVSAVFLPLGFLTGLLGINVGGLPGQDDPRAFTFVVLLCLGIGCAAGVFFKARDWI
jgi:zinc transporter